MKKEEMYITNMSCAGCERTIRRGLMNISGVNTAVVSFDQAMAVVAYDDAMVSEEVIQKAIQEMGYGTKDSPSNRTLQKVLVLVGALLLSFLMVNNVMGADLMPHVSASASYGMLFMVGIVTSLHCISMCGGINLSQSMNKGSADTLDWVEKITPSFLYNTGRLISYTLTGAIAGGLGSVVSLTGGLRGAVVILSGTGMALLGAKMLNLLPSGVLKAPNLLKHIPMGKTPLVVGFVNALMPCGALQAMQIYALGTGSPVRGAMSMFFFALGTYPLMFGLGAISSMISGKYAGKLMKAGSFVVLVLGLVMVGRGLNLSGVPTDFGLFRQEARVAILQESGQYVYSQMMPGEYETITVQAGVPVVWEIEAQESDLNGCNNPIEIPSIRKSLELVPGKNTVTLTFDKPGNYVYTCWMGMIAGRIQVVENLEELS